MVERSKAMSSEESDIGVEGVIMTVGSGCGVELAAML